MDFVESLELLWILYFLRGFYEYYLYGLLRLSAKPRNDDRSGGVIMRFCDFCGLLHILANVRNDG